MERKLQKLEKDMLRRVSQLLYEVRDPIVQQGLVSVSNTQLSKDLRVLKVFVTVNRDEEGQREVMESLKRATRFIRGRLGENLDVRFTPEIRFHLDDSPERAARIANILSGLPSDAAAVGAQAESGVARALPHDANAGGDSTADEDPDADTSEDVEESDEETDR